MSPIKHARLLSVLLLALLMGCGQPKLATVTGRVTYNGTPLEHGQVVFMPEPGTVSPLATGEIEADGTFVMNTQKQAGVTPGAYRVTVHCRAESSPERTTKVLEVPKSLIPERYSRPHESPFRFEVKPGENDCPLVLERSPK